MFAYTICYGMGKNELSVTFLFDEASGGAKVESLNKQLTGVNNNLNNLKTDKAVSEFSKLENAGLNSLNRLKTVGGNIEKVFSAPNAAPLTTSLSDLDKQAASLGKRADETRKSFAQITSQRLNSGNINSLTKDIVAANERSRQLEKNIAAIKTQLASPNRTSTIKQLTSELKSAEIEADNLNRKLSSLPSSNQSGTLPTGKATGGRGGRLTDKQLTGLELLDDFAPTGTNRAFNSLARIGLSAQNIKEANGEMTIFNRLSVASLGTFGAIAAAGFVIVSASEKIREQAEKRLLNEQLITGAINKQILGLRDAFTEYEKFKRSLIDAESFTNRLSSAVNTFDASAVKNERGKIEANNKSRIEEINRLQAELAQNERSLEFAKNRNVNQGLLTELGIGKEFDALQKRQDIGQAERAAEKTRKSLAESEAALEKGKSAFQQTDAALKNITAKQNELFNQRNEIFKKSYEDFEKTEIRRAEIEKKRLEDLEKAKEKIKDLSKTYNSVFSDLSQKQFSDNPFVQLFSKAGDELKKLRENLRGLPADLQNAAISSQQAINKNKLFETRLENNLSTFDLRETANNFRNPKEIKPTLELFESTFKNFVEKKSEEIKTVFNRVTDANGNFGGFSQTKSAPFTRFNTLTNAQTGGFGGFYQTDLYTGFNEYESIGGGVGKGGTIRRDRTFNDLSKEEKRAAIDKFKTEDSDNLSLNNRLQRQLSIINSGVTNDSERGLADRKLIGLTSGLDPAQIKSDLREQIAAANEREATRRETGEREAMQIERDKLEYQRQIAENGKKLLELAEKGGLTKIEVTINADGSFESSEENNPSRATNEDTGKLYGDYQRAL